jgi:hypothetical protein
MRDLNIWRSELISEISTISSMSELKRLWSGHDVNEVSSFSEEVAHIFDDYDINGFIDNGPFKAEMNAAQFDALCEFRHQFSDYVDRFTAEQITTMDHDAIFSDPKWLKVIAAAYAFINTLSANEK